MKRILILSVLIILIPVSLSSQISDLRRQYIKDSLLIDSIYNIGYKYYHTGVYDSSEYYFLQALDLQEAFYGHFSEETASSYTNLGAVYRRFYHLQKALEYYNKAEMILKDIGQNSIYLGFVYNNKGNIYWQYSDYAESERYYKYSIDLFRKIGFINNDHFDVAFLNLFNIYLEQNRLTEAEEIISEIENLEITGERVFKKHMYLAEAHDKLGRFEQANSELIHANNLLKSANIRKPQDQIEINFRRASILIKQENYDQALTLLLQNISMFHDITSLDFQKLAESYSLVGQIYFAKADYKNAYTWLNEAVKELKQGLKDSDIDTGINSERILHGLFTDIKWLQAQTAITLYTKTNNSSYLNVSNQIYKEIIDDLIVFRLHMRNEESIFQESASSIALIHEAIKVAILLFSIEGDQKYLDQAFYYTENTKSFALLSNIRDDEAFQFAGLPNDIQDRELFFSNEIGAYEELLFNENTIVEPDSAKITYYSEKLFDLLDDRNTLKDSIENNYPDYYKLKYDLNFISLSEVQTKLRRKEALVEYVLTDTMLITFVIDKNEVQVLQQVIPIDFSEDCIRYFRLLQNQNFGNNVRQTYRDYTSLGREFYKILIAPVLEVTSSREITFVPDGEIMYLPFESFITEDVDSEYIDYHSLPYLIYDLSVGYSYSSTLLFSERLKSRIPERKVLAFAPSYENPFSDIDTMPWNRQAIPDYLFPLKGARQEVKDISRSVPSKVFMDSTATEANFKKFAPNYSILHLAMHTIMNDEDPMHSKLAFTRLNSDSIQDHDLYTYEIYNMKLNAEMVVLSSCSSGFGKMQRGEGMMSLSRGFMYAGCPSIIMTLWQVSDKSSASLMANFYKHLKRGKSKKKSLREAKIDYIQSSDKLKSNPYFWSAFLMVGDNSPLYRNSALSYWAIILGSFSLIVVYMTYRRSKPFSRKKT